MNLVFQSDHLLIICFVSGDDSTDIKNSLISSELAFSETFEINLKQVMDLFSDFTLELKIL